MTTSAELDAIIGAVDDFSPFSPRRLAFISLIAAFEADLFDLARLALQRGFVKLASKFDRTAKIQFSEIEVYSSLDEMRDGVVDAKLDQATITTVLSFIKSCNMPCVDTSAGYSFGHILELIARRNAHLHNRGRVDDHYLGLRGSTGPCNV